MGQMAKLMILAKARGLFIAFLGGKTRLTKGCSEVLGDAAMRRRASWVAMESVTIVKRLDSERTTPR